LCKIASFFSFSLDPTVFLGGREEERESGDGTLRPQRNAQEEKKRKNEKCLCLFLCGGPETLKPVKSFAP
jgi:hypothetical protein